MIAVVLAAVVCVAVVIVATSHGGSRRYVRRYREPRALRAGSVAMFGFLFVLNVIALLPDAQPMHGRVSVASTMVAVGALPVALGKLRIKSVPVVPVRKRTILAVGAHPDDLELAAGGTIAKLVDAGHNVHAVVMCRGRVGGDEEARLREAHAGAAFLGVTDVLVHDFPDTRLSSAEREMVDAVESAIKEHQPDMIMTHSFNDQHQDHHAVHLAVMRAARSHHSILCFESPSVTRRFDPCVFVDIADYIDVKVEAVLTHRNQGGKPYMTPERVRGMAAFRGNQAKVGMAEGFEAVRLLGSAVGDL